MAKKKKRIVAKVTDFIKKEVKAVKKALTKKKPAKKKPAAKKKKK